METQPLLRVGRCVRARHGAGAVVGMHGSPGALLIVSRGGRVNARLESGRVRAPCVTVVIRK